MVDFSKCRIKGRSQVQKGPPWGAREHLLEEVVSTQSLKE